MALKPAASPQRAITTLVFDFANVLLFAKRLQQPSSLSRMYAALNRSDSIWDNYFLNEELLEFLESRKGSYQMAILTASYNLPKHPEIEPKLRQVFADIFLSGELEHSKHEAACYTAVLGKLGAEPGAAIFIDDSLANTQAAAAAGLHTIHFQNNGQLFNDLKQFGIL